MVEHVLDMQEALVSLPSTMCLCASHMLSTVSSVTGLVYILQGLIMCVVSIEMLVHWY